MQEHDTTNTAAGQPLYITITEAAALLGCSYSKAQQAVSECNKRQKTLGLFTITGRCLRSCFMEYIGASRQEPFFYGSGRVK